MFFIFIYLFIYIFIYLFIYSSIYLFICNVNLERNKQSKENQTFGGTTKTDVVSLIQSHSVK